MPTLREVQLSFSTALRDSSQALLCTHLIRARGLDAGRRIQVYRNNSSTALREALIAVYPVTQRLVGEVFFDQAARSYLRTTPSRSGDIHAYGDRFPEFIGQFRGARAHAYLRDVARLEWLYHEVFHSELSAPLDIQTLTAIDPADYPRLHFGLQNAARLFKSAYPVLRIWQVNQPDYSGDDRVDLDSGATRLLIQRDSQGVTFQSLGLGELRFLQRLARGRALNEALSHACAADPDFDLSSNLQRAVLHGSISRWYLHAEADSISMPVKIRR
jgi:hypothetical protein